ncbi:hypothetical protein CL1_1279 [Thermococcus cleftensis]|uniref:DUF58 domain-containing protein n=1 Tax=Thermococcus cleftensis (strain DSM 27260 / KACC 17922 / CL1) TaxID=163003 RepID=I3ZUU4_THECF|nr:DUF58 domain-containing protein [Thermococcus cleftensis]AFL95478.1 hypothetical protein CL1_1279 [Thermococcus cleftensis]
MKKRLVGYVLWALILGTALLAPGMIALALVPLSVLALAALIDPPGKIEVRKRLSKREIRLGEEVEVEVEVSVGRGLGIVAVKDRLPRSTALTAGSNARAFFKGPKPLRVRYTYRIKPTLRGTYTLPRTEVTARNPLGTRYRWGIYGRELLLIAVPEMIRAVPVTGTRRKARISVPETSFSIRGPISTDFKEIRDYRTGDPMKLINWKATARTGRVLVNEFEREGKKAVLFIVDAREEMKVGTEGESPYEHAMKLVASTAHHYLRRDYHVGLYLLGARKFLPPTTGRRQLESIVRTMMDFERVPGEEESLSDAVERLKRALVQYSPLVIYVSNVLEGTKEDTTRGLRTVGRVERRRPVLVDVSVYPTLDERTGTLIELEKRAVLGELEGLAHVVRWVPGREDLGETLSKLLGEIA